MINTLTSLRIFFVLIIFGAHYYVLNTSFDTHFFKEGFVGVSSFSILSGFIIAYNYQEELLTKTTTKRTFWVARIAYIYPLHLLILLIAAYIGGYVQHSDTTDQTRHFVASIFLLQPFLPSTGHPFFFNSPSWSLGYEQLFYSCFPLVIPFLNNRRKLLIILSICLPVMLVGIYLTADEQIKVYRYVNPITRLPGFSVGVSLYQIHQALHNKKIFYFTGTLSEVASVILFLLLYLCTADISKVYRHSCYYWLPASLTTPIFAFQKEGMSRLLFNRFLTIGGEISYNFYPIYLSIMFTYTKIVVLYQWQVLWMISVPLTFGITITSSLLSYYYFEKPVNKWVKRTLTKKQS